MTLIKIVNGDLLESKENLILHQVNCQGKMNSGVAKAIREKWERVFYLYELKVGAELNPSRLLGQVQSVVVNPHGDFGEHGHQYVVNLFSQDKYGYDGERYTNYEALYRCLEQVAKVARLQNYSVALPYNMGCDRGGANWNIVYTMIEEVFKNHTQSIVIYNLNGQFQHSFLPNLPPTTTQELVLH